MFAAAVLSGCGGSPFVPVSGIPAISCPTDAAVISTNGGAVAVPFSNPVVTGGSAPVTSSCNPPSGISFPVGTTTVTCTATDAAKRTASCTFPVVVNKAPVPTLSLTRFVAFGDSITWGEDGHNVLGEATAFRILPRFQVGTPYPAALLGDLQAAYPTQASLFLVDNWGCPGEQASGSCVDFDHPGIKGVGLAAFDRFKLAIAGGQVQGVLLMEGANDLGSDAQDNGLASQQTALNNLSLMVEYAKQIGVRPYLATLPPENADAVGPPYDRGGNADLVLGFNASLAQMASSEGIALVDVNGGIGFSDLAPDGLHLSPSGYQKMALIFLNKLTATLQVSTPSAIARAHPAK